MTISLRKKEGTGMNGSRTGAEEVETRNDAEFLVSDI